LLDTLQHHLQTLQTLYYFAEASFFCHLSLLLIHKLCEYSTISMPCWARLSLQDGLYQ
jgi:hypothetical protein